MELTPENRARFDEIVARYPDRRAAMLPTLWLVQRQEGWISPEAMEYVGDLLGVPPTDVQAVVSFYTMYDRRPPGRYKLQVCRTLSCALMGAYDVLRHLEQRLGIHDGQTTPDGLFTLQEVECLGSCGTGPMMQVNDKYVENLTREHLDALIERLAAERPQLDAVPEIHGLAEVQRAMPVRVTRAPAVDARGARGDGRGAGTPRAPGRDTPARGDGRG